MSDPRGMHLGDGAYVVPDPHGDPGTIWLAANDHRNRVIALDGSALVALVLWLSSQRPELAKAMTGVGMEAFGIERKDAQ